MALAEAGIGTWYCWAGWLAIRVYGFGWVVWFGLVWLLFGRGWCTVGVLFCLLDVLTDLDFFLSSPTRAYTPTIYTLYPTVHEMLVPTATNFESSRPPVYLRTLSAAALIHRPRTHTACCRSDSSHVSALSKRPPSQHPSNMRLVGAALQAPPTC